MEGQIYKVIKDHIPAFHEPIILKKGDKVTIGREFTEDPDWPNWIECKNKEGMKGWVPKQYLKIDGKTGLALRPYSANELSVKEGNKIIALKFENGWAWSKKYTCEYGWVPLEILKYNSLNLTWRNCGVFVKDRAMIAGHTAGRLAQVVRHMLSHT